MNLTERNEGGMNFDPEIIDDQKIRKYFQTFIKEEDFQKLVVELKIQIKMLIFSALSGEIYNYSEFISKTNSVYFDFLEKIAKDNSFDDITIPINENITNAGFAGLFIMRINTAQYYILLCEYKDLTGSEYCPSGINLVEAFESLVGSITYLLDNLTESLIQSEVELMQARKSSNIFRDALN
ncbi:MAG: hypothetical protein ABI721_05115 [Candidatus Dojkabacteria bacterium]